MNQHVARDSNAAHRRVLLQTVAHMHTLALASEGRFALLRDMNAAPGVGRWGYSLHSKTLKADRLTLEWAQQCGLKEVPNIHWQRHAKWKACLHPRKAILDRAWVSPPDLPFSSLSVHWNTSQPVFDHAMIMFRLSRTAAGLGFAEACRPLYRIGLLLRCRVDLKKMRDETILSEW